MKTSRPRKCQHEQSVWHEERRPLSGANSTSAIIASSIIYRIYQLAWTRRHRSLDGTRGHVTAQVAVRPKNGCEAFCMKNSQLRALINNCQRVPCVGVKVATRVGRRDWEILSLDRICYFLDLEISCPTRCLNRWNRPGNTGCFDNNYLGGISLSDYSWREYSTFMSSVKDFCPENLSVPSIQGVYGISYNRNNRPKEILNLARPEK